MDRRSPNSKGSKSKFLSNIQISRNSIKAAPSEPKSESNRKRKQMTQPIKAEPLRGTLKIKRSNLNLYEENKEYETLRTDLSKLRIDLYSEISLLKAKI